MNKRDIFVALLTAALLVGLVLIEGEYRNRQADGEIIPDRIGEPPIRNCAALPDETLKERIIRHEGRRKCPYQDTRGNWTQGIGHLLPQHAVDEKNCWTGQKVDTVFNHDLERAEQNAHADFGHGFYSLPADAQDILTELSFWIGGAGLSRFTTFMDLIGKGEYAEAAVDLEQTLLARQVPGRTKELACLLQDVR